MPSARSRPAFAALLVAVLVLVSVVALDRRDADADRVSCRPQVTPVSAVRGGVASSDGLGPLRAPYRLRAPAGRPRGVVMLLHGGAWRAVGRAQLAVMGGEEARWLGRGWATANVDYRACDRSLGDVLRAHDAIRRRIGDRTPLVVEGQSAGAQLALLVAAARPRSVGAVVAEAPPTDPGTIASQTAFDPEDGRLDGRSAPTWVAGIWRAAFGAGWRTQGSPVAQARRILARVVLAHARRDHLIPIGQTTDMARALRAAHPRAWLRVLPALAPGPVRFPHARISVAAERQVDAAERDAVAPWQRGPVVAPRTVAGWWGPGVVPHDATVPRALPGDGTVPDSPPGAPAPPRTDGA